MEVTEGKPGDEAGCKELIDIVRIVVLDCTV